MRIPQSKFIELVNYLEEQGYDPVYISLYGSQNYNLENANSDYDFKVFVKPKRKDLFNNIMTSRNIEYNGGIVEIRDFRYIHHQMACMNPNFLELFITENYWCNSYYVQHMSWIRNLVDALIQDRFVQFTKAVYGAMCDVYEKIQTPVGHNPKKLYTLVRLYYMFKSAEYGQKVSVIPTPDVQKILKSCKEGQHNDFEALEIAKYYLELIKAERAEIVKDSFISDKSINRLEEILFDLFQIMV